jgi:hypothetical protein
MHPYATTSHRQIRVAGHALSGIPITRFGTTAGGYLGDRAQVCGLEVSIGLGGVYAPRFKLCAFVILAGRAHSPSRAALWRVTPDPDG